jgi:hypothetical protein
LKPGQANTTLYDLITKKPITKKVGGVAQVVVPEFKHQYLKKKKKNLLYP